MTPSSPGRALLSGVWAPARGRPGNQRPTDLPVMPEGILDASQAPAVLLDDRMDLERTGDDRPGDHRVRIVDNQKHSGRRPAHRLRTKVAMLRRLIGHPERCIAHRELSD